GAFRVGGHGLGLGSGLAARRPRRRLALRRLSRRSRLRRALHTLRAGRDRTRHDPVLDGAAAIHRTGRPAASAGERGRAATRVRGGSPHCLARSAERREFDRPASDRGPAGLGVLVGARLHHLAAPGRSRVGDLSVRDAIAVGGALLLVISTLTGESSDFALEQVSGLSLAGLVYLTLAGSVLGFTA